MTALAISHPVKSLPEYILHINGVKSGAKPGGIKDGFSLKKCDYPKLETLGQGSHTKIDPFVLEIPGNHLAKFGAITGIHGKTKKAEITSVKYLGKKVTPKEKITIGSPYIANIHFRANENITSISLGFQQVTFAQTDFGPDGKKKGSRTVKYDIALGVIGK